MKWNWRAADAAADARRLLTTWLVLWRGVCWGVWRADDVTEGGVRLSGVVFPASGQQHQDRTRRKRLCHNFRNPSRVELFFICFQLPVSFWTHSATCRQIETQTTSVTFIFWHIEMIYGCERQCNITSAIVHSNVIGCQHKAEAGHLDQIHLWCKRRIYHP